MKIRELENKTREFERKIRELERYEPQGGTI